MQRSEIIDNIKAYKNTVYPSMKNNVKPDDDKFYFRVMDRFIMSKIIEKCEENKNDDPFDIVWTMNKEFLKRINCNAVSDKKKNFIIECCSVTEHLLDDMPYYIYNDYGNINELEDEIIYEY